MKPLCKQSHLIAEAANMRDFIKAILGTLVWAKEHGADAEAIAGFARWRHAILARTDGEENNRAHP